MVLPMCFLQGLKLQIGKKIGVASLFSLGLVVIVIDAIRLATGDGGGVVSQASLYNALEPSIAVLVSCLPTYRSLFRSEPGSSKHRKGASYQYSSGIQQNWKSLLTPRYRSEGYESTNEELALTRPSATLQPA